MNTLYNSTTNTINWNVLLKMNVHERQINSYEEYVLWVREWKAQYKEVVEAITFFRNLKNQHRDNGTYIECNSAWNRKISLRPYAHKLLQARIDNKAALHEGKFFRQEQAA
jgi:hypothetical protein